MALFLHWLARMPPSRVTQKQLGPWVQFPVQCQPQHNHNREKNHSFMTNINCIFPGTLVPRCNDNCCFITLCGALLHAILRSNIWWKNSLYSGLQRFKEAGSEKVPDPLVGLASSFLPKYSMIWPERALVHRNQAYTRLKCTQHSPRLTRGREYANIEIRAEKNELIKHIIVISHCF